MKPFSQKRRWNHSTLKQTYYIFNPKIACWPKKNKLLISIIFMFASNLFAEFKSNGKGVKSNFMLSMTGSFVIRKVEIFFSSSLRVEKFTNCVATFGSWLVHHERRSSSVVNRWKGGRKWIICYSLVERGNKKIWYRNR